MLGEVTCWLLAPGRVSPFSCELDQTLPLLGRGHAALWAFCSLRGADTVKGYLDVPVWAASWQEGIPQVNAGHFLRDSN